MNARAFGLSAVVLLICMLNCVSAFAGSVNLLKYLPYEPAERYQANCGNCWVWAGTGVMEIARAVRNETLGVPADLDRDRLSIQFLDSCDTDPRLVLCKGGNVGPFADFYLQQGFAVPWSNTNAQFQDQQGAPYPSVACSNIVKLPNYPLNHIEPRLIPTIGVGRSTAIANLKRVLDQRKAVQMNFFLPNGSDWGEFNRFWGSYGESTIWNPDFTCGHQWIQATSTTPGGGGHAVIIVGYNDDHPDPAQHYWLLVNSWGIANGLRMNGAYRQAMNVNYDCGYPDGRGSGLPSLAFYEYNHSFGESNACTYSISPTSQSFGSDSGSGGVNVSSQPGCSWSVTGVPSWVTITSGASGSGSSIVRYTVSTNTGTAAREAAFTVAGKEFTIVQEGGATLPLNILRNGDFESGLMDWTEYSSENYELLTNYDLDAYSGSWFSWLGGFDDAVEYIYQDVQVPANARSAYLQFHYNIETEEVDAEAFDQMTVVLLRPTDNAQLKSVQTLSNLDATEGWVTSGRLNISEFAGQTVRLVFGVTTDYALATSFFIDDVSLSVTFPPVANLAPYQPAGWSDKVVVSHQADSNTDGNPLESSSNLYLNWAVENNGSMATPGGFSVALYLDSVLKRTWNCLSLDTNSYCHNGPAYSLGSLGVGTHWIRLVADSANTVAERDESENSYTKVISVVTAGYSIAGTVRSAGSGAAIAGASVSIGGRSATTDAGGAFSISGIPPGTYTLTVSAQGYATYTNPAFPIASDQQALVFTLTASQTNRNVVISGGSQSYAQLQQAYNAAVNGAVLLARQIMFAENVTAGAPKAVSIKGGYDSTFTTRSGRTTVKGLLIRQGKIVADGVSVQ